MSDHDAEYTREILRKVRQIEIRSNRLVAELFAGSYHSAFKGQGIDFEEVREYQPGDEVRTIDWNVTAREGFPFVKQYKEERELTIVLAVDISKSTQYGSSLESKREKLAELAALVAFSACRNGDKVGLLLFSDQTELYLPPAKGHKHALRILREVLFRPTQGKRTDLNRAIQELNQVTRRRAVIFLLSDFIVDQVFSNEEGSAHEVLYHQLSYTRLKHDLICVRVFDPRETELPDVGLIDLKDLETDQTITLDTSDSNTRKRYAEIYRKKSEIISQKLKKRGIDEFILSTQGDYSKDLFSFFKRRGKRRFG
jgi:uncharacterized protein (DUF58 family)